MDDLTSAERRQILDRDGWQCTSGREHRHRPGEVYRCTVSGSEIVVKDGRAQCPMHARGMLRDAFKQGGR